MTDVRSAAPVTCFNIDMSNIINYVCAYRPHVLGQTHISEKAPNFCGYLDGDGDGSISIPGRLELDLEQPLSARERIALAQSHHCCLSKGSSHYL